MHRCILAALALTAGCIEIPPPYTPCVDPLNSDADGDGWSCNEVAFDCDDNDPSINPGAIEILNDGIDQDCNQLDLSARAMPSVSFDTTQGLRAEMERWSVGFATGGSLLPDSIVERQQGREWLVGAGDAITPGFDSGPAVGVDRNTELEGPIVANVDVTWNAAGPPSVAGDSHFAFLYDSTILRQESFSVGAPGFSGGGPYDLTSYLDLDPSQFDAVSWLDNPTPVPLSQASGVIWQGTAGELGYLCAEGRTPIGQLEGAVIATWRAGTPAVGPTLSVSATALHLGFDFMRAAASVPGATQYQATMRYRYAVDSCIDHPLDDPERFQVPPTLQLDPQTYFETQQLGDLDQDGFDESNGYFYLWGADHVGFRVRGGKERMIVRAELYNGSDHGVTVWRDGVRLIEGEDYVAQLHVSGIYPQDAPGVIVALNDAADDADYVISAPGGEPGNGLP